MSKTHTIGSRAVLAHKWIPRGIERLLDAGCDDGNNTFLMSSKASLTWGIDTNKKAIELAQKNYPQISFSCGSVETTPFQNNFFDVIVMNDVFEHVADEIAVLNEMFRILKKNGQLIISTPHQGMFAFMDPANYKYLIKNKTLLRLVYGKKEVSYKEGPHRHYTLGQFSSVLDKSNFAKEYKIEKVFRSGLVLGVLAMNLKVVLRRVTGERLARLILTPLAKLASLEYWLPFGPLAYNIAISVRKS